MSSSNTEVRIARAATMLILALALLAASLWAATGSALAARCEGAYSKPSKAPAAKVRNATRCLINRRRAGHGLKALRGNQRLRVAAQRHTRHMVRRNRFSHTGAGGSTPLERVRSTGYLRGSNAAIGENIAWGEGKRARPKAIVRAWMDSSGHRRIILERRFRHLGIGVRRGSPFKGGGGATYTADFGRR
jgi:uncharacterized protein YkwD